MRAAAVLAFLAEATLAAQAPPQFSISVDAVRIDALVLDGDRPVSGLTAANFEVLDAGVPQRIDAIGYEGRAAARDARALDTSYSVNGEPLAHLRDAAAGVIGLLAPRDRAAVLTFASEVDLACDWTGDRERLARSLDRTRGVGATALHDAAYAALVTRDTEPGRALVLLFTDGDDTVSWLPGETVLETARRTDAVVYTVGIGENRPGGTAGFRLDVSSGIQRDPPNSAPLQLMERILPALARESGGKYVDAQRTGKLREVFTRILREFRTRYVITYTPQGVDATGWHPLDVKLKGKRGKVTARRGYLR